MTDTALKPCPFCGGEGYIQNHIDLMFFASCHDCYCCVGEGYDRDAMPEHLFNSEEAAREAWNTRAALSAHPHPVETVQADVQPVQRYDMEGYEHTYYENGHLQHDGFGASPIESDDGEYVLFIDHQAAVAALKAEREEWRTLCKVGINIEALAVETSAEAIQRAETAEAALAETQREMDRIKAKVEYYSEAEGNALNDLDESRIALAECQREKEGLRHPFRNCDDKDWDALKRLLGDSGHGRFWKAVMLEVRTILLNSEGA